MRRNETDETYAEYDDGLDDEFYVDRICENVRFPSDKKEHEMHGNVVTYKLSKEEIEKLHKSK